MRYNNHDFYNLPEGVTTDLADGFQIADVCPAECSEVVSRVIIRHQCSHNAFTQCSSSKLSYTAPPPLPCSLSHTAGRTPLPARRQRAHRLGAARGAVRARARARHHVLPRRSEALGAAARQAAAEASRRDLDRVGEARAWSGVRGGGGG